MADYSTLLKTWGDAGEEYPNGYQYVSGEQPVDAWDNFVNSNLIEDVQYLIELTNKRLESGRDSSYPGSPERGEMVWRHDNTRLTIYDDLGDDWYEFAFMVDVDAVQSFADSVNDDLQAHKGDTTNPHNVTAEQAGAPTTQDLADHEADNTNPHAVTYDQVDAPSTGQFNALQNVVDGKAESNHGNEEHDSTFWHEGIPFTAYAFQTVQDAENANLEAGTIVFILDEGTFFGEDGR